MTELLIVLIAVASGLVGIYSFGERQRRRRNRRRALGWTHVDELVVDLIAQVKANQFAPSVIVGVGPGGAIVAAMMATNMEEDTRTPLVCIETEPDPGSGRLSAESVELIPDLTDQNVLVCVGELYVDGGLREAVQLVQTHQPASVRTLALLVGPRASVRPDFMGRREDCEPVPPWSMQPPSLVTDSETGTAA